MSTILTNEDRASATWARLRKHLNDRRDALRTKNDQPMSEAETAVLRGRIAEIKALLDLETVRPIIE